VFCFVCQRHWRNYNVLFCPEIRGIRYCAHSVHSPGSRTSAFGPGTLKVTPATQNMGSPFPIMCDPRESKTTDALCLLTLLCTQAIIVPHRIMWSWCTGRCNLWAVTFGTARRGLGGAQPAQSSHRCTKCNSPPINGQCTDHRIAVIYI